MVPYRFITAVVPCTQHVCCSSGSPVAQVPVGLYGRRLAHGLPRHAHAPMWQQADRSSAGDVVSLLMQTLPGR